MLVSIITTAAWGIHQSTNVSTSSVSLVTGCNTRLEPTLLVRLIHSAVKSPQHAQGFAEPDAKTQSDILKILSQKHLLVQDI